MNSYNNELHIYLERVGSYLPFSGERKQQLLEELKPELEDAMKSDQSLENTFGDPKITAKNILQSTQFDYEYASWKRRLTAFVIDTSIIWTFLLIFVGIPLYLADRAYDLEKTTGEYSTNEIMVIGLLMIYSVIVFGIGFSYYIIPERLYGQTIGKRMLDIHVMDVSGIRVGWKQVFVRNIAKYNFEFLPLEFVLGWLIKDAKAPIQKATDVLAETRVVRYTNA